MAIKDAKGNWIDGTGATVPPKYVRPVDKKRDAMVERLFREAVSLNSKLAAFRKFIEAEFEKFLDYAAENEGMELNKGGNYTFSNFSYNQRFIIQNKRLIDFDEHLQMAKQKIDSCLDRWSKGGNDNIRAVVLEAFKVDQKSRIDIKAILKLRKHNIKDKEWVEAMELITKAITITGTREYILFQFRPDSKSDWQTIRLDLAGV